MFYLLSLISGMLELGYAMWATAEGYALWKALCFPLAYHIGNLFPVPFRLGRKVLRILCVFSVLLSIIFCIQTDHKLVCGMIVVAIDSAVIQSARSVTKVKHNTSYKRLCRMLGFALSPMVVFFPKGSLLIISFAGALISLRSLTENTDWERCGVTELSTYSIQGGYSFVMFFHQLHYFLYAYVTVLCISEKVIIYNGNNYIWWSAIGFVITWITYTLTEKITKRYFSPKKIFLTGHIGLTILLMLLSFYDDQLTVFYWIIWIIMGLFGGCVYSIGLLAKERGVYSKKSMELSENLGHFLGTAIATLIAVYYVNDAIYVLQRMAAGSAIIVVLIGLLIGGKK